MEEKGENKTSLDILNEHKNLIEGKLVSKTLSDVEYSDLSVSVYGKRYSNDVARRMMYGSRYTLQLLEDVGIDNIKSEGIVDDIDSKIIELKKEKQKFCDQRSAFNKIVRERSREEELVEIIEKSIGKGISEGSLPILKPSACHVRESDNDLLVSLNDIHYGLVVSNAWSKYNPDICREMMSKYLGKILEVAERHGSENCYVFNNGDSISGNIHLTIQIANKENVINQVKGVTELISQFLAELSKYFTKVIFISVAGNHSRLNTKENSPIDERLDDLISWYLKARLQNFDNIYIEEETRIDPTMYLVDIRGKMYCGVHGDMDGSAASISGLQSMVRHASGGEPLYAILLGHLHHNKVDEVHGVKTIMAGSFVGTDDFCISKRIYGRPEQMICVCTDSGVECYYDVPL